MFCHSCPSTSGMAYTRLALDAQRAGAGDGEDASGVLGRRRVEA